MNSLVLTPLKSFVVYLGYQYEFVLLCSLFVENHLMLGVLMKYEGSGAKNELYLDQVCTYVKVIESVNLR